MSSFTSIEQESIILNVVWSMIDDMVNYEIFVKSDEQELSNLVFYTMTHRRLFNVLLVDFLSRPQASAGRPLPFDLPLPPTGVRSTDQTYLFYLRRVCDNPQLGGDPTKLTELVESFASWLEAEAHVERVWFPSIELALDMNVERMLFIKICGNTAKHNFSRLSDNVNKIVRLLKDHDHSVNDQDGYLLLPEFQKWFHEKVFAYHATTIAEYLNNIRWAIFDYLLPQYHRSYERVEPRPMYKFNYPDGVSQPIAKAMYWDLMNMVRSRPYFRKFVATDILKRRY